MTTTKPAKPAAGHEYQNTGWIPYTDGTLRLFAWVDGSRKELATAANWAEVNARTKAGEFDGRLF